MPRGVPKGLMFLGNGFKVLTAADLVGVDLSRPVTDLSLDTYTEGDLSGIGLDAASTGLSDESPVANQLSLLNNARRFGDVNSFVPVSDGDHVAVDGSQIPSSYIPVFYSVSGRRADAPQGKVPQNRVGVGESGQKPSIDQLIAALKKSKGSRRGAAKILKAQGFVINKNWVTDFIDANNDPRLKKFKKARRKGRPPGPKPSVDQLAAALEKTKGGRSWAARILRTQGFVINKNWVTDFIDASNDPRLAKFKEADRSRPAPGPKPSEEEIIAAIIEAKGNRSGAAAILRGKGFPTVERHLIIDFIAKSNDPRIAKFKEPVIGIRKPNPSGTPVTKPTVDDLVAALRQTRGNRSRAVAVLRARGFTIDTKVLRKMIADSDDKKLDRYREANLSGPVAVSPFMKELIAALKETNGSRRRAAAILQGKGFGVSARELDGIINKSYLPEMEEFKMLDPDLTDGSGVYDDPDHPGSLGDEDLQILLRN